VAHSLSPSPSLHAHTQIEYYTQPTGFLEQKANNNNAPSSSSSYKRNYIFNFFCFFVFGFDISWKNPSYSNGEKMMKKSKLCSAVQAPSNVTGRMYRIIRGNIPAVFFPPLHFVSITPDRYTCFPLISVPERERKILQN
jgi:hypothetical protein